MDNQTKELYQKCSKCNGDGYTAEHACMNEEQCLTMCPVQVQCEQCKATGFELIPSPAHTEVTEVGDVDLLKEGLAYATAIHLEPDVRLLYAKKYYDLYKESLPVQSPTPDLLDKFIAAIKDEFKDQNWGYLHFIADRVKNNFAPTDTPKGYTVEANKVIRDLIKWIPDTHIAKGAISNAIDFLNSLK